MQHIFIHGMGQDPSYWDRTISLINKNIHVKCPDLYKLTNNEKNLYADLYSAFSHYCDSFSEPLNLCGISLGGVLALNYAIDNPKKMQSLVLIGTQYKMPRVMLKIQNAIFNVLPKSVFEKQGVNKKVYIDTAMELLYSMMDLNFEDRLKDILCDTLIICGNKDSANKGAAKYLANNISNAELKIIKKSGHDVTTSNPIDLAMILSVFYSY